MEPEERAQNVCRVAGSSTDFGANGETGGLLTLFGPPLREASVGSQDIDHIALGEDVSAL